MIDLFLVRKFLTVLLLPPTGSLLIALIGLLLVRKKPRLGYGFVAAGVLSLLALSLSPVSRALMQTLDDYPAFDYQAAKQAQAIVVLGGGVRRGPTEYGGDTMAPLTAARVRYGAWVAKRTGLPVLVSGGGVYGGRAEAQIMRDALEHEFGVPVKWIEAKSRNTHENAQFSVPILRAAGVHKVVLINHVFDMRRAREEFAAAGMASIAAPTGLRGDDPSDSPWLMRLTPNMSALQGSYYALYEIAANWARRLGL